MQNSAVKSQPLDMVRWREIVEAWNGNIETQQAYCKRLGISLNTFSYARSKLQQKTKPKNRKRQLNHPLFIFSIRSILHF